MVNKKRVIPLFFFRWKCIIICSGIAWSTETVTLVREWFWISQYVDARASASFSWGRRVCFFFSFFSSVILSCRSGDDDDGGAGSGTGLGGSAWNERWLRWRFTPGPTGNAFQGEKPFAFEWQTSKTFLCGGGVYFFASAPPDPPYSRNTPHTLLASKLTLHSHKLPLNSDCTAVCACRLECRP